MSYIYPFFPIDQMIIPECKSQENYLMKTQNRIWLPFVKLYIPFPLTKNIPK